jgi:hypothetical protein
MLCDLEIRRIPCTPSVVEDQIEEERKRGSEGGLGWEP